VTHTLQLLQLLNLLTLTLLGARVGHLYLSLGQIGLLLLGSGLLTYTLQRTYHFATLTTTLGVVLMMVTPHFWIYGVVIALALLQKQLLHYHGRHLFNPSNFALIMALLLFYHDAHIVLGQLGDNRYFAWGVIGSGVVVLWRAKRWIIPLAFLLSYLGSQYWGIVAHDPLLLFESVSDRFYSVSFLLFMLFMLTDPRTTPTHPYTQALFGVAIALGATLLDYHYGFRVQHLFVVLFALTPLTRLLTSLPTSWQEWVWMGGVLLLVASAIIYLQNHPPYYFEMDG